MVQNDPEGGSGRHRSDLSLERRQQREHDEYTERLLIPEEATERQRTSGMSYEEMYKIPRGNLRLIGARLRVRGFNMYTML